MPNDQQLDSRFEEVKLDDRFHETTPSVPEEDGFVRTLKDTGLSALQGGTLSAADEIGGALEATGDVVFGDTKLQDWVSKYRQHQQEQQQAFNEAKERSPIASTVGELAGGLALPMGAIGAAGKGVGMLGRAGIAAGMGGLAGGLSSEGTVEQSPGKIAGDALTGGAMGAAGGAILEKVLPALGGGLGKLGGFAAEKLGINKLRANYPSVEQSIIPFTETMAGRPFLGEAGRKLRDKQLSQAGTELDTPLNGLREVVNERFNSVLSHVKGLDVTPQLENDLKVTKSLLNANKANIGLTPDQLASTEGKFATSEAMGVEQLIDEALRTGKVDAQDLKEIQKFARDQQGILHDGNSDKYLDALNKSSKSILEGKTNGRENVPGYGDINGQFGDVEDTLKSFAKKIPIEELDSKGKKVTGETLYTTSMDTIAKAQLPYDVGKKQAKNFDQLIENLHALDTKDPSILQSVGIKDIPSFVDNIKKSSNIQATAKSMRGAGQMGQSGLIPNVLGGGKAGIQYGGAVAGSAINITAKTGAWLAKQPSQALTGLAQGLASNKGTTHMGQSLLAAIEASATNPSSVSKNAALFTILQNPEGRKMVQQFFPGEDENVK